jgi:ligand-binding sensor domain-containing protein
MLNRIIVLLTFINPYTSWAQAPLGQWRDHLPYQQVFHLTNTAGKIWAATPYSIFSVDISDNSIDRYTTNSGLNETGISAIGGEPNGQQVVIAYNNSNIDVLNDNNVNNINALKNANRPGDKNIYAVFVHNRQALLSTGFGIVVIDLDKYEVKDTWIIGNDGSPARVHAVTLQGNFFYAATAEGIKKAPVSGVNLADFRNWQLVSGANGLPAGSAGSVASLPNQVIALRNDSLYMQQGNNWSFLYTDGWTITNLTVSANKILLSEVKNNTGRIVILTNTGVIETTLQDPKFTRAPRQAIVFDNGYWIADTLAGLSKYNTGFTSYLPDAPPSIATGAMQISNNILVAGAGSVNTNWEPTNNKYGVFQFSNNTWTGFNTFKYPALDTFTDVMAVAIDPVNGGIWAGSFGGGLANIKPDNAITIYKQGSAIQPAYFANTSYRVSALAFDADQHLWIANYGAEQSLHVKKADGGWRSFSIPFPVTERAVSQIVIDDLNQKWIVLPKSNGLGCFNNGASVDNPADDRWKWYRTGKGNGNLPDNQVLCLAKDKNNFLWVGTAKGIGVIQCAQEVFTSSGCDAVLPVVQQDNFAGYLFRDEQVQSIAVDGANRKWVATRNGVWLISDDAAKTIYRFTASNSPLLHNDVKQIAIDHSTGEVYFATARGICSFRSTATETTGNNSSVLVFPNPVPPGYTGTIAIRGITNNAIVKITELDGRLVYQTRALGGQATWNGKNYKGQAIATGVYLVLVSDDTHKEKMVTKIVYVHK